MDAPEVRVTVPEPPTELIRAVPSIVAEAVELTRPMVPIVPPEMKS